MIEANVGDTIVVNMQNNLGNESTSLHFHGMYQTGTQPYDGPVGVTQCPVNPGSSFTYTFKAYPAGTHWYHSHDKGQYPDGLRGKMIIHDPAWEKSLNVVEQIPLTMGDWYHTQMPELIENQYLAADNTNGNIPSPNSFLFNETNQPLKFTFAAKKRYLLRMVSLSALTCSVFQVDGLTLTVVAVDGIPVEAYDTKTIFMCAGQSIDVVVVGPSNPLKSVQYIAKMTTEMLTGDIPPDSAITIIGTVDFLVNGILTTLGNLLGAILSPFTVSTIPTITLDDIALIPVDRQPLLTGVTKKVEFQTNQTFYPGIGTRIAVGNQPFVEPKVPSLFTAFTTGQNALNESTYGPGTVPQIYHANDVVQIYMTNPQPWPHPMHLHGHDFQVAGRGLGSWDGQDSSLDAIPVRRDTVVIPANGYLVLRFTADNPGVWYFHCHIDFHLVGGMAALFIEAPEALQGMAVPAAAQGICSTVGQASSGNCNGVQGALSAADAEQNCNTIFNTPRSHGATV
jgi:iron transport multicopper oxidase